MLAKRTFADSLTLADASMPVELKFLGRANTSGDVVVWLPRERVLIAGDIVVEPVPFMIQVFPVEWLATVDRLRQYPFAVLVPGHGVTQRDRRYVDRLAAFVVAVREQVAPLARAGVPLDSIAARTQFDAQRSAFAGSDAWLGYWFDLYALTPLIESVYSEALGRPLGPPAPPGAER